MRRASHAFESLLVHALAAGARALPPAGVRFAGAGIGALVGAVGIRRRVAVENLRRAFPDWTSARRDAVLAAHYRELGRVALEYPRIPELLAAPRDEVFGSFSGVEHLHAAAARGHGVLLLTGHLGNFELVGAAVGRIHPVDFVVKPLSNPGVERWVSSLRARSGVGTIPLGPSVRAVFAALRKRRWVALLGDQDARRHGVFVPFFGTPASTPEGPARIALATGAPICFGRFVRGADGRPGLSIDPPIVPDGDPRDEDAVRALTLQHVRRLEDAIRAQPEMWFWLHRRWKTAPPPAAVH